MVLLNCIALPSEVFLVSYFWVDKILQTETTASERDAAYLLSISQRILVLSQHPCMYLAHILQL